MYLSPQRFLADEGPTLGNRTKVQVGTHEGLAPASSRGEKSYLVN